MDSGYYAAMTGLVARTQALDIAATNLGPDAEDSQLGQAVNNFGLLGGDRLNLAQGALNQTGNPLDLAIQGEGFFMVQSPNGSRYTRDGGFHRSPAGLLVTAAGEPVLSAAGKLIPVPPGEVSVGADGSLSVAGGVVATVGVYSFPAGTQLTPEGANRYVAPEGVEPALAKNAAIHQGAIEAANQDTIQGTLDMTVIQRQAEMMQKALTIFHTDFNKIATEDIPRV
jgi:flagellar basal-body rod protein FlgF/flagellar basal-body rod protein FlgG